MYVVELSSEIRDLRAMSKLGALGKVVVGPFF
jgi:hypothetical protein